MVADTVAPWAEAVLFTANDLAALPEDTWRYELVEGRLVRMAPTGGMHGGISAQLVMAIGSHVRAHGLGTVLTNEPGFLVSTSGEPDTVLAPDVAFVSAERVSPQEIGRTEGYPRLAPDLAVEIASPSQSRPELSAKAELWLKVGARLVWVIWPRERQVDVWLAGDVESHRTLNASDELDGDDVLPGFKYGLSALWP